MSSTIRASAHVVPPSVESPRLCPEVPRSDVTASLLRQRLPGRIPRPPGADLPP